MPEEKLLFDDRYLGSRLEIGFGLGLAIVRDCFSGDGRPTQLQEDMRALYSREGVRGTEVRLHRCRKLIEEAKGILDQTINNDGRTIRQLLWGKEEECVSEGIQAGARRLEGSGDIAHKVDRAVAVALAEIGATA